MLAEGQVAYLHIGQMTSYTNSQAERETLLSFFDEIKDVPSLIIDIQNNGGGNDRFWLCNIVQPLASEPLIKFSGGAVRAGDYLKPFSKQIRRLSLPWKGLQGRAWCSAKTILSLL